MMRTIIVACVLGTACGDPGSYCEGGCPVTTVAIAADGDFDDWASVPAPDLVCSGCAAGDVIAVRTTRTLDDRVAFFVETEGTAVDAIDEGYQLYFAPFSGPTFDFQITVFRGGFQMWLNANEIAGLPVEHAIGLRGAEVAVPASVLPFAGAFRLFVNHVELRDNQWIPAQDTALPFVAVCFDPAAPLCHGN